MTIDRQIKAVIAAIAKERWIAAADMLKGRTDATTEVLNERYAKAAIEASDAKYVPMLVEALKELSNMYAFAWDRVDGGLSMHGDGVRRFESAHAKAEKALSKLPPELRGE